MTGYRGFESKELYEKHYSGPLPQWELDAMEDYSKEAMKERETFKMSDKTKSCNLTEDEIECLMGYHGRNLDSCSAVKQDKSDTVDRINYLNKRLKTFNEADKGTEVSTVTEQSNPAASGW